MDADDDRAPPLLGQAFADERERQGLSRTEVAQRLHMSAWQIEALETGDYGRLPKGTFLRGFVRNYAKVLAIDPAMMLERLAEATPRGPAQGIVVPTQNIRFDPIGERLGNPYVKAGALAVVFVALGFAAMYWWLFIRPTPPAATLSPPASSPPASSPPASRPSSSQPTPRNLAAAPMQPPEPVVPRDAPTEPMKAEPRKVPPPSVEPVKAEPVKLQATSAARTIKLRFKGESWVEVKDRSGKVLLSKLNLPGSEAEVSGRPPFNVIIGNAPDVQVRYNDREFPLEPHTRVAVARFTVE